MIVIPFLLLLPTVLANSVPFQHVVNANCPNSHRPCTIILEPHTNYSTHYSPARFVGYPSVEITGGVESNICFDNGDHPRIFFGNITKVVVKNIQFKPCEHLHVPTYNPNAVVAPKRGLSFRSISNLTILNSKFSDFHGVMVHISDSRHVLVNNNKFESRNNAFFSQAIFYTSSKGENSSLVVSESSFHGLVSWPGDGLANVERSHGAGMSINAINTPCTVKISRCQFTHCRAAKGPALSLISTNHPSSFNLIVEASNFSSNFASVTEELFDQVRGGAIAIVSGVDKNRIDISHCLFHNNTAKIGNGGAISILSDASSTGHSLVIRNSHFTGNSAWLGGAISVVVVGFTLLRSDILEISHCHFEEDSATSGGAIFAGHYDLLLKNKNVFSRNSAHVSGGAFFIRNSVVYFIGSNLIVNNNAQIYGGAFYLGEHSKIIIANGDTVSNILGNTAGMKGGALYVDQRFIDTVQDYPQCFIQPSLEYSTGRLVFEGNRVTSVMHIRNVKPCLGNDIFSRTMAYCSQGSPLNETLAMFQRNGIILKENCSISTEPSRIRFSFLPMCNISIKGEKRADCVNCTANLAVSANIDEKVYRKYFAGVRGQIKTKLKSGESRGIETLNLVFPGYYSKFRLELLDEFNQTTISDISLKFFGDTHNSSTEFKNVHITPIPTPWIPTVEYNVTFAFEQKLVSSFFFGRMCAGIKSSYGTSQIQHCINLMVSNCPGSLFKLVPIDGAPSQYTCRPQIFEKGEKNRLFSQLYKGTNDYTHIQLNPYERRLIAMDFHENISKNVKCEFFNCKCNSWLVPPRNCNFNLLTPYDQCKPGLMGPYCTECKEEKQLPSPLVSILRGSHESQCYTCWSPYIGIPLFFVLAIAASTIILSLRIDIFNDYTRSIAFYSSILYLYVMGCGQIGKDWLFRTISVFISISNLLITQNYPFCLSSKAHSIKQVAIFNEWSPFVFFFFIMVVYFLFSHVSFFQRYNIGKDIHFPMWTLFILSYCNLCIGALVPFQCNSANRWLYDSKEKCNEPDIFFFSSIVLLVILLLFPLILVALSYRSRVRFIHITGNYENRFRRGYKLWEVMKLFCRFVYASIFLLPYMLRNPKQPLDNCTFISIFSLLLLLLNSLFQPATNRYANHFESFCLFILAIIGILANLQENFWSNDLLSLLVLSPYLLFVLIKLSPILKLSTKYLTCKKRERT